MPEKTWEIRLLLFSICILSFSAEIILADEINISVFAVAISSPSDLSAVALSYEQIDLSWSPVPEATSYNIYKSGVLIASVETTNYSVTGLSAETLYSFSVSSVNGAGGESSLSDVVLATTLSNNQNIISGGSSSTYYNLIIPAKKKDLIPPPGGFKIYINDGVKKTNNASVMVYLNGGPDAVRVEISNNANLSGAIKEEYSEKKPWVLSESDGAKKVFARFISSDGAFSPIVSANIVLDTKSPQISIDQIKDFYTVDEEIILKGSVSGANKIIFSWDRKYGSIKPDGDGEWMANLGKMVVGSYSIILMAKDDVNNVKTIVVEVLVKAQEIAIEKPAEPLSFIPFVFKNIGERIKSVARFTSPQQVAPQKIIIISKDVPQILSGEWNLLNIKPLKQ